MTSIERMSMHASNFRVRINQIDYEWVGGFGAILRSHERGVKQGDVRVIGGVTFYAYRVNRRRFKKPEVCWTIQGVTADMLRTIRAAVFT